MAKFTGLKALGNSIQRAENRRAKKGIAKRGKVSNSQDPMNKTVGTASQGFTELTQGSQGGKKESMHGSKNQKAEVANQLQEMIREYFMDNKDLNLARLMANRTGMIINDIQVPKLLADSTKAKERYILILESSTFDPAVKVAPQHDL